MEGEGLLRFPLPPPIKSPLDINTVFSYSSPTTGIPEMSKKLPTEVHVYLDPDTYKKLARLAKENYRSMTAQCSFMLQEALRTTTRAP